MAPSTEDLVSRLLEVEVSALCDADKTLPVVDPAITLPPRPMPCPTQTR